jgi:restriction system protein
MFENLLTENKTMAAVIVMICCVILALLFLALRHLRKLRNHSPMDDLEGHEFESYCADLLEQHGFTDVEVTNGSRDFGIDILAEKDGITYAVQCKRYESPIGVFAIQQAYAGRDYYDCMVGVVMTNQYFTQPAVDLARKLKILLWDRGYIDAMIDELPETR